MSRKIIHCDCDCFFAAIEMRDNPSLKDLPLAIGGKPEQRGVIATCNYVARAFGVRSAMSSAKALRLCSDLLIMLPDMEKYRFASKQMLEIYHSYTRLVEPLSLDEAFLDVSHSLQHRGSATLIAAEIRERIAKKVGITVSAGIAPNKFVAKIASDWNKPDGLFVVRPDEVEAFIAPLPVNKVFGVGKVTEQKLHHLGIKKCGDLRKLSIEELQAKFGSFGERLYTLCRGKDEREVEPNRERKSISVEHTYPQDIPDLIGCVGKLALLFERLNARIERLQIPIGIKGLFIKLRFDNFSQTTVECMGKKLDVDAYKKLLEMGYFRYSRPVRLIGIGVRMANTERPLPKQKASQSQLVLF